MWYLIREIVVVTVYCTSAIILSFLLPEKPSEIQELVPCPTIIHADWRDVDPTQAPEVSTAW